MLIKKILIKKILIKKILIKKILIKYLRNQRVFVLYFMAFIYHKILP